MAGWRFPLLVLALVAPALAWGDAPLTSPLPRSRPAVAAAPAPPPRPAGAMTISEAAAAEALRAAQAETVARQAARSAPAARIEARRAVAEHIADSELVATEGISPQAVATSLIPRHRTAAVMERFAALAALAAARAPGPAVAEAPRPARSGGPSGPGLCGVRGLSGRNLPRITSSTRGCGVAEPVSVTSVDGIPLSMAATVDCAMATAFERWVRTEMLPAVGNTGGGVQQIRIIGDYSCRTRNSQPGARISEHARGMALDFAGFRLADGTAVTVQHDYRRGRYSRMLRRMYRAGCGIFHTTLSPDSDRFHQDHFHFDMASYRNGGSYCH